MLEDLLRDPDYREQLAEAAYLRERAEDAARDREHDTDPADYFALSWSSISDPSRRPYRTAVAHTCDELLQVVAAIA